jgi:hypothetical protein
MNPEFWKDLCPELTGADLQAAQERFDAYLELAWEIFLETQKEPPTVDASPDEP